MDSNMVVVQKIKSNYGVYRISFISLLKRRADRTNGIQNSVLLSKVPIWTNIKILIFFVLFMYMDMKGVAKNLPSSCTSNMDATTCFLP
ncbi:pectin acetylesterase 12-like [Iris pallida]|uniref:Pectin acetylesterase 12-like n=1 Tax=Iris pallida TaxID=29817 RepID=A0AAX6HYI4_IRIPA|nr:pectin acetylesterase 12-like [Iris pallida]